MADVAETMVQRQPDILQQRKKSQTAMPLAMNHESRVKRSVLVNALM